MIVLKDQDRIQNCDVLDLLYQFLLLRLFDEFCVRQAILIANIDVLENLETLNFQVYYQTFGYKDLKRLMIIESFAILSKFHMNFLVNSDRFLTILL